MDGDEGNDSLLGGHSFERMNGGEGSDVLDDPGGGTHLDGGPGHDELSAQAARYVPDIRLDGGEGNDSLRGTEFGDVLTGGEDDDRLEGWGWRDRLSGGTGNDHLQGDGGDDVIDDEGGDDRLDGGSENDFLNGGPGRDRLFGEDGGDVLNGGRGSDEITGGSGNDLALYLDQSTFPFSVTTGSIVPLDPFPRQAPVIIDPFRPRGDGEHGEDDDVALDVERVDGGASRDVMTASPGGWVDGAAGNDTIIGSDDASRRDILHGGSGGDALVGRDGPDSLDGDTPNALGDGDPRYNTAGADQLDGGLGDDRLNGGRGPDRYLGGEGNDVIESFDNYDENGLHFSPDQVSLGSSDEVFCGAGTDTVSVDPADTIAADCEVVVGWASDVAQIGEMVASTVRVGVRCRLASVCRGRLKLTWRRSGNPRSGIRLGEARFSVPNAASRSLDVPLNERARRFVRGKRRLNVTAVVRLSSPPGAGVIARYVTIIRNPGGV